MKTCLEHAEYCTGCISCQHDMAEEIEILTVDRDRWKALAELAVELTYKCYPHVNDYYIKKHGYDVDYWNMVKMRKEMEAE